MKFNLMLLITSAGLFLTFLGLPSTALPILLPQSEEENSQSTQPAVDIYGEELLSIEGLSLAAAASTLPLLPQPTLSSPGFLFLPHSGTLHTLTDSPSRQTVFLDIEAPHSQLDLLNRSEQKRGVISSWISLLVKRDALKRKEEQEVVPEHFGRIGSDAVFPATVPPVLHHSALNRRAPSFSSGLDQDTSTAKLAARDEGMPEEMGAMTTGPHHLDPEKQAAFDNCLHFEEAGFFPAGSCILSQETKDFGDLIFKRTEVNSECEGETTGSGCGRVAREAGGSTISIINKTASSTIQDSTGLEVELSKLQALEAALLVDLERVRHSMQVFLQHTATATSGRVTGIPPIDS